MDFINYITELPSGFNVLAVVTAILVGVAKTGVSGMAILVVPLIAMVFPAKESVGALLPMLIAGDILAVIYYRHHAQWGQLGKLVPGVAVGMLAGGLFLGQLDNESMRNFLGGFVLLLLVLEGIARHLNLDRFKADAYIRHYDWHHGRFWNDRWQLSRSHHGHLLNYDGP